MIFFFQPVIYWNSWKSHEYLEETVINQSKNHDILGDSVAWAGCTIMYLLGQQLHFELFDFSYQFLNVAEVEGATLMQHGAAKSSVFSQVPPCEEFHDTLFSKYAYIFFSSHVSEWAGLVLLVSNFFLSPAWEGIRKLIGSYEESEKAEQPCVLDVKSAMPSRRQGSLCDQAKRSTNSSD